MANHSGAKYTKFTKKFFTLIFICLLGMVMIACSSSTSENLVDTSWQLLTLHGNPPISSSTITIDFTQVLVSGTGGCNRYRGGYQTNGDNLVIAEFTSTWMACAEILDGADIMDQEQSYLKEIGGTASYKISAGQLVLFNTAGNQILVFSRR